MATRGFAVLFGIGSLANLRVFLSGEDLMAFLTPFLVFVASVVAERDTRNGREARARVRFAGAIFAYLTLLMGFAPSFLRLVIGFPLACLTLLLFHLAHRPRSATLLGWGVLAVVVFGFAALFLLQPEAAADWMMRAGFAAQVLVLAFANYVLARLGRGWVEALAEAQHARSQLSSAYEIAIEASRANSRAPCSTSFASIATATRSPAPSS